MSSLAFAKAHGLAPMARITGYATGGGEPKDLFFAPIKAVENLLKKAGTVIGDYDLIEANEAFAVQALADGRALGWDWDRVNVNGGAIALGHPIGASGARVLTTLLYAMRDRKARTGLATLCLGGGNAVALVGRGALISRGRALGWSLVFLAGGVALSPSLCWSVVARSPRLASPGGALWLAALQSLVLLVGFGVMTWLLGGESLASVAEISGSGRRDRGCAALPGFRDRRRARGARNGPRGGGRPGHMA